MKILFVVYFFYVTKPKPRVNIVKLGSILLTEFGHDHNRAKPLPLVILLLEKASVPPTFHTVKEESVLRTRMKGIAANCTHKGSYMRIGWINSNSEFKNIFYSKNHANCFLTFLSVGILFGALENSPSFTTSGSALHRFVHPIGWFDCHLKYCVAIG